MAKHARKQDSAKEGQDDPKECQRNVMADDMLENQNGVGCPECNYSYATGQEHSFLPPGHAMCF